MPKIPTSAIILAAGFSSRMGQAKFGLRLMDGKTFLEHIIEQYLKFGCQEIVLVLNCDGRKELEKKFITLPKGISITLNTSPERGRFTSVQCGLRALKSKCPSFIHNVDNPFAHLDLLESLAINLKDFDFVKPTFQGRGGHPILISQKTMLVAISEKFDGITLRDFLGNFKANVVDFGDASILTNLNTPEELKLFLSK